MTDINPEPIEEATSSGPPIPFPASPYCRVRARVASIWADGPDEDTHPDWRPATGERITLTPSIGSQLLAYDAGGPDPIIVTVERVECIVDEDGWLTKSDGRPVFIAPTDDPLMSATGWTWTARIKEQDVVFTTPSGGVVDLALFVAVPATDDTKVWVERIPELIDVAESLVSIESVARDGDDMVVTLTSGYVTRFPLPEGVPGPEGPQGEKGDKGDPGATSWAGITDKPTIPDSPDDIGAAPATHSHVLADITDYTSPDLSGLAPLTHTHSATDISDSSAVGRALLTASNADSAKTVLGVGSGAPSAFVVTVPNTGWSGSVTLSVPGLTGPHIVSPVTVEGAQTWAAGGWWASSPGDGQLTIEGAIQPSADPVDVRVLWWEAP